MCLHKLLCSLVLLLSCVVNAQSTPIHTNTTVYTHSSTYTFEKTSTVLQSDAGTEYNGKAKLKQYYLGDVVKVNWFKAMQMCRSLGMQLVSIASEEEYTKLSQRLLPSGHVDKGFWTSGSDLAEKGEYVWMANGQPLGFAAWRNGQPDNTLGSEDCLELYGYSVNQWEFNDQFCDKQLNYICEY